MEDEVEWGPDTHWDFLASKPTVSFMLGFIHLVYTAIFIS